MGCVVSDIAVCNGRVVRLVLKHSLHLYPITQWGQPNASRERVGLTPVVSFQDATLQPSERLHHRFGLGYSLNQRLKSRLISAVFHGRGRTLE